MRLSCLFLVSKLETNSSTFARSLFVSGFGHQNKLGHRSAKIICFCFQGPKTKSTLEVVCFGFRRWSPTLRRLRCRAGRRERGKKQTKLQIRRRSLFVLGFQTGNELGHRAASFHMFGISCDRQQPTRSASIIATSRHQKLPTQNCHLSSTFTNN